jgi:hypothetical protein
MGATLRHKSVIYEIMGVLWCVMGGYGHLKKESWAGIRTSDLDP